MKELMIKVLKEMNKDASASDTITRLYYGGGEYVEDYSHFANEKYMSRELLDALKSGATLTEAQEDELEYFRIEAFV